MGSKSLSLDEAKHVTETAKEKKRFIAVVSPYDARLMVPAPKDAEQLAKMYSPGFGDLTPHEQFEWCRAHQKEITALQKKLADEAVEKQLKAFETAVRDYVAWARRNGLSSGSAVEERARTPESR